MKLQSILLSSLFAAIAALPLSASAADADKAADAKPAAEAKTEKMKPHSHMTDKTGVEAKTPAADAPKAEAKKDKKRHLHPRDGK